ncbi:MAG: formate/nitrite transporter family protein [Chitinophagaceae bacterium]|nr:formate/nitrite transporter family protein [Chitinophagaceae bacterium]
MNPLEPDQPSHQLFGFDAFSPKEIAERIENVGVTKAKLAFGPMLMLGILAGVFIGLGSLFFMVVSSDPTISFGISRLLGGLVFSLGLVFVVVAGAELFTGNNLIVMAWADGRIKGYEVIRNWGIVCLGNLIGAVGLAVIVYLSGHPHMNHGEVAKGYIKVAAMKCQLPFLQAFFSGMLCNIFVCLAVWMAQAGRSVIDKVVVILFPVAAFVAAGFEHSIANMYFIPMGILLKSEYATPEQIQWINALGMIKNLFPVILGNLVGGSGFVALFYYLIYRKK